MRHPFPFGIVILVFAGLFSACNPSKYLKDNEYLLTKNTVKIEDLAIFKASVESNASTRYGIMRAQIGPRTTKVNGVVTQTGNAVKNVKLLAQATGEYTREELNKDATLGWTKKAQELIDADKALMNQANP